MADKPKPRIAPPHNDRPTDTDLMRHALYVMKFARCSHTDPQLRAHWAQRRQFAIKEMCTRLGVNPDYIR